MGDIVYDTFKNQHANLCFYRQSLRGVVQDYIVTFDEEEYEIERVVGRSYDLFEKLMERFKDTFVKVRLIAQINFLRLNESHEVIGNEDYHFCSYQAEEVHNAEEFYQRHMCRIASRLEAFNQNGSRLMINRIKHIHISLTMARRHQ